MKNETTSSMSNEELAAYYIEQSGTTQHASDCSTSIAPAERPGPCDCGGCIPKHYHKAHYEDGKLTRQCERCGEDLMHESHVTGRP